MWSWSASLERRAVQPSLPYDIVAEQLDFGVSERDSARHRQQQLTGPTSQCHGALAMFVGPSDGALLERDRPFTGGTQTGIGGVQMYGVATLDRQRLAVFSALNHNALEKFVDPVGCHVRVQCEVGTDRDGGVGPVHRILVKPPPNPPMGRPRSQEGPQRSFPTRLF